MNKRRKNARSNTLNQILNQPLTGRMIEALGGIKLTGVHPAEITSPQQAAKMGVLIAERLGKTDRCNLLIDDGKQCWEVRIVKEEPPRKSKPTIQ